MADVTQKNGGSNPAGMDLTARTAFKRVYPFIARYVLEQFQIDKGWCVDLGSGPASLAIAMAKISNLQLIALDCSREMGLLALKNSSEQLAGQSLRPVQADVHALPLRDDSIDLIISRGSLFFWEDRPAAFREIYRVLKTGGVAFCGGGMGSETIRREADAIIMNHPAMIDFRDFWQKRNRGRGIDCREQFLAEIKQAGLEAGFDSNCQGLWIVIRK